MKLASIVLCAGKGTRMKSRVPKVLHSVAGRPLGAWSLARAFELGASPVIAVVGHEAEAVKQGLAPHVSGDLRFALQAEQRGTGHAVMCGLESLPDVADEVLVLYGDTPLLRRESLQALIDAHARASGPLAMLTTTLDEPSGYGRIVRGPAGEVRAVVEHKDCSEEQRSLREVNPGIYLVDTGFLRGALAKLGTNNAQGELYLTDLVAMAAEQGGVTAVSVSSEETLGVNDRCQLAESERVLRDRLRRQWMLAGVTLEDPATTYLDVTVSLGSDVVLGPGVVLRGDTRVADLVHIGTGCVLSDTVVDEGARLAPYTVCEQAHVGPAVQAGPFARLRPGADLRERSRVGNFVEVKKTVLGKGAKANHLAYLGDAVIGEDCNVGAGTITCNYDGIGKHKTVLGDRVFIGSNSTLVAPVTVESDAYVGAASTISRDVPKDALAIARARQENKEGYAARIRSRNERRAKR